MIQKAEIRLYYENLLKQTSKITALLEQQDHDLLGIWKTNHSLQLTRNGIHFLKLAKLPLIGIQIENGRSMAELLMLANTMDVPYFLTEKHTSNKLHLLTLESDRTAMLVMHNGNVPNWAAMYRND